jgi:Tol biopolymer transport system component
MSPEQAAGKATDCRTDIWSLGVVLYEMAAGTLPFAGESDTAVARAILNDDPEPLTARRAGVPLELDRVLSKALAKDPGQRYQHADEFAVDLRRVRALLDGRAAGAKRSRLRTVALTAAAALALVIVTAAVTWRLTRPAAPQDVLPQVLTRLTYDAGLTTDPALSPDGKLLAYASDRAGEGNLDIWVQQIGGGEPLRLTQDTAEEREPSFSPDGTRIVFRSTRDGGGIYVMPALRGAARKIAPEGAGPVFSPDGESVAYYTGGAGGAALANADNKLFVVNPAGGAPREIRTGFAGVCCTIWTPDGKHLLFLGNRDANLPLGESLDWWVVPLDGGPAVKTGVLEITRARGLRGPVPVAPAALLPEAWTLSRDGVIFSARSGDSTNLWQVDISPRTFKAAGEARRFTSGTAFEWQPSVAARPGGGRRVVFASLSENSDLWSLPVVADQARPLSDPQRLTENAAAEFHPDLSADGRKLVFVSNRTGIGQVWLKSLETGEEMALTSSPTEKYGPRLSPDGSAATYSQSATWPIYLLRLAGGGEEIVRGAVGLATSWIPDGSGLLYHDVPGRVSLLEFASGRRTELLAKPDHRLVGAAISPDGQWLAFSAMSGGGSRIFVAPYQGPVPIEEKDWIPVTDGQSADKGSAWSRDSKVIYYLSDRDGYLCIWAQRLDATTKRPPGAPVAIYHEHSASRSLTQMVVESSLSLAGDRLVFNMGERTGSIWMAEWGEPK